MRDSQLTQNPLDLRTEARFSHHTRLFSHTFRPRGPKARRKKATLYQSKTFKTGFLAKNGNFLTLFGQKIPNFEFSHGYHYSHTLVDTQEKTLGSFQPKLMTKIEVISQKPSKNWIFGKNGHFLTVFGQKWPIFDFFSKIRLEHFFTLPKPYLTAKFQKKVMSGCPDIA